MTGRENMRILSAGTINGIDVKGPCGDGYF